MEINLLGADEIKYELTIRGLPATGSFSQKRTLLRDAMRMEREGRVLRPTKSYLQTETDLCVCQAKLYILERDILNFDHSNKDGESKRIYTFLLHVEGRLHRIQAQQQSEVEQQNKLIDKCQQLIGNLQTTLEGIPRTLIRDQNVASVQGAAAQDIVYSRPENNSILDAGNEAIENSILPPTIAPQERTQVSYDLIHIDGAPSANISVQPIHHVSPSNIQHGFVHSNDPPPYINASRHSVVASAPHPQVVNHVNVSSRPITSEGEVNCNPLASSTNQRPNNPNEYVEQRRIIHAPTRVSLGTFSTGTLPTTRQEQSNFFARPINFDVSHGTRMATDGSERHIVDLSNSSGRHILGSRGPHNEPIDLSTAHEPAYEFLQSEVNPLASVPVSRQNLYQNQAHLRTAQTENSRLPLPNQPVLTNPPRSELTEPHRILNSQPALTNLTRMHTYQVHSSTSDHYSGRSQPVSEYSRETGQTITMPTAFSSGRRSSQVHFADQPDSRLANVNSTRRDEPLNHPDPFVDLADRLDNFQFSPLRGTSCEEPRICSSSFRFLDIGKWDVKFNGQSSVNDFLERIEELRVSRGATKEQLLRSAPELFCGDALLWFRTCNVVSWDDLVSQLRDTFQPYDYEFALWDEIRRRTQGAQERVISFVASMENLFRKLPVMPSETTRLQMIRRNLLPYIQSRLATHQILSLQDLVRLSRAVEETESRIQRFVPPSTNYRQLIEPALAYHKPSNYVNAIDSSLVSPVSENTAPTKTVLCWNCQEVGHQFRQCTKPRRKFCYRCGKADVVSRNCSSCSKNVGAGRQ